CAAGRGWALGKGYYEFW
nr:immunoglobulin heavy chain junction region [Macaca mulatta]